MGDELTDRLIREKMERLEQLERSAEKRKARLQRYREKQREMGYQFVSLQLHREDYRLLRELSEQRQQPISDVFADIFQAFRTGRPIVAAPGQQPEPPEGDQQAPPAADTRAALISRIGSLQAEGRTWAGIADALNAEGSKTPTGREWTKINLEAFYRRSVKK